MITKLGSSLLDDENTGNLEQFEVPEGYRMPPEIKERNGKIYWEWVNEVWKGTKIDGRFYIDINPVGDQRESLDNPSKCKLPINGRKYSDINSTNVSLVSLGIPYQLNYNIYKYRLELEIARSKDIIAQFDINMIPKKWDMDKLIITAAITGGASPMGNPYLPKTPKEQVHAALECYYAGASVVHIHARNPETFQPEQKVAYFQDAIIPIREQCDIIINVWNN